MPEQTFVAYPEALRSQQYLLPAVGEHVTAQIAGHQGLLEATSPCFVGIGASLAAAALPVALLRARGVSAHRTDVGDLGVETPSPGDVVVAISQSGRSRETIEAVASHSSSASALVNVPHSPLTSVVSRSIDLGNQPDSKASTIGFTGTLLALGILAQRWNAPLPGDGLDLEELSRLVGDLVHDSSRLRPVVDLVTAGASVDLVAAGPSVAAAEEGALLLREVSRVPAAGYELRNYLHGYAESATLHTSSAPTVNLVFGRERSLELVSSLHRAGCSAALITDLEATATKALSDEGCAVLTLPRVNHVSRVIAEVVICQLLAEAVADRRGVSADEFVHSTFDTKIDRLEPVQR